MANKKQPSEDSQQLNLFEISSQTEDEDFEKIDLESLSESYLGFDGESQDRTIQLFPELLTLKLLRQAIKAENPDDLVMADFAEYVLPNLLRLAIGVTAKGGKFFDKIDRRRAAEGKDKVRRDNAGDQSLNTHLPEKPLHQQPQLLFQKTTPQFHQIFLKSYHSTGSCFIEAENA